MDPIPVSRVMLQVPPAPWDDLVRRSAALLERDGITSPQYIEAIFASIDRNGAYMLVAPGVLLAHARPEEGAISTGMSLITTSEEVPFVADPTKGIRLFFTLAAADTTAHLALVSRLAEVLVDANAMAELVASTDPDHVRRLLCPEQ